MKHRDRILALPETVQTVIRMKMTKEVIGKEDTLEEFEKAAETALAWWDSAVTGLRESAAAIGEEPPSDLELAELLIRRVRKTPLWGKILRGDAN